MRRKLAFAAVPGRTKGSSRGACQDAVFGKHSGNLTCIALSDGAGSKKHSGTGARAVVRVVVRVVLENFDAIFEDVAQGGNAASKHLLMEPILSDLKGRRFAKDEGINDYACTLIFAATNRNRLLLGHIGDGFAFSVEDDIGRVASWPENGEFANETYFVTSGEAMSHLRLTAELMEQPRSILLASDGAAVSLFKQSDQTVAPAVSRLCGWAHTLPRNEMNSVLTTNLETVFREKTTDDCSIAISSDWSP